MVRHLSCLLRTSTHVQVAKAGQAVAWAHRAQAELSLLYSKAVASGSKQGERRKDPSARCASEACLPDSPSSPPLPHGWQDERRRGRTVRELRFGDSPHCGHFRLHREEYIRAIAAFLREDLQATSTGRLLTCQF